jgi:outer membrane protein W
MRILLSAVLMTLIISSYNSIDAQMRPGEVTWSTNAGLVIPTSRNDRETLYGYGINVGVDKIISDGTWSVGLSIAYYNVSDRFQESGSNTIVETETEIYPMYITAKKHFGKNVWVPYLGAGLGYQLSQVKSDWYSEGSLEYLLNGDFSGVSVTAILGIYYFFTPDWLLNASFTPIWLFDTPVDNVYNSLFNLGIGFQID